MPQLLDRSLTTSIAKMLDMPAAAVSTDLGGIRETDVDLSQLSEPQIIEAVLLWKIADRRSQELLHHGHRDAAWTAYVQRRRNEFKSLAAAVGLPV